MGNKEYPVSEPTLTALKLLEERENLKVQNLERFISQGRISKALAESLTEAQSNLVSEPEQIYLLIGDIICQENQDRLVDLTKDLCWTLGNLLTKEQLLEYIRYELLFRREADNKLATLVFRLLQQAKQGNI